MRRTELHHDRPLGVVQVNLRDVTADRAQAHADELLQASKVDLRLVLFGGFLFLLRRADDDAGTARGDATRVPARDRSRVRGRSERERRHHVRSREVVSPREGYC